MRKHEALYGWIIIKIRDLADSEGMEAYANGIGDDSLVDSFTKITEKIRNLGADLHAAQAARELSSGWSELSGLLRDLQEEFADYCPELITHMLLYVSFAKKLVESLDPEYAEEVLTEQIDENAFSLYEIENVYPTAWFAHENTSEIMESAVIFSAAGLLGDQSKEFDTSIVSPTLLFHLLCALSSLSEVPVSYRALAKSQGPAGDSAAIDAFARLLVLASGRPVNQPRNYSSKVSVLDMNSIKAGPKYQQWNELFKVISDYNSVDDLLIKYLFLYHVVENLMFKLPIVELEKQHDGKMFSIRNFRQLYKKVEVSEKEALSRMFKNVLQIETQPGLTFQSHIVNRWQTLSTKIPSAEIEEALGALGIFKKGVPLPFAEFRDDGSAPDYFSQMVYALRCAIVHNKETELHLTHAGLNAAYAAILEDFLIPSIEELSFALIGVPNDYVWYQHQEMALYK